MPAPSAPSTGRSLIAWLALIALAAWLCVSEHWFHTVRGAVDVSRWINGDVSVRQMADQIVFDWIIDAVVFAAIGALAVVALNPILQRMKPLARWATMLFTGLTIAGVVRGVQLGRWPDFGFLVLPLVSFLFGAALGRAILGGPRTLVRFAALLGVATVIIGGLAFLAVRMAIDSEPLAIAPPPEISRRALADALRGVRSSDGEGRHIRLTERELNALLAIAANRISPDVRLRTEIDRGSMLAEISLPLPGSTPRFANIRVRGLAEIADGRLTLHGEQFSIGSLHIPGFLVRLFSRPVSSALSLDRDLRSMIGSVASLRLRTTAAELTFHPGECSNTFIPSLALAVTGRTSVAAETRIYVRQLVENAGSLPSGDARFVELLRRAFALARERSAEGDPIEENRAAILALAILLGHPRVETVVGPMFDESLRERAQRELTGVTLRGRTDWTKHFALSAGMVALACEGVSDRVGLLKELRDAQAGGSGFSFGDMAANRAGIQFARVATFNAESARMMQERLAQDVTIGDVFPEVSDLPEDMPAAEFQRRFGGANSAAYERLIAEIDRRLARCSVLRP